MIDLLQDEERNVRDQMTKGIFGLLKQIRTETLKFSDFGKLFFSNFSLHELQTFPTVS